MSDIDDVTNMKNTPDGDLCHNSGNTLNTTMSSASSTTETECAGVSGAVTADNNDNGQIQEEQKTIINKKKSAETLRNEAAVDNLGVIESGLINVRASNGGGGGGGGGSILTNTSSSKSNRQGYCEVYKVMKTKSIRSHVKTSLDDSIIPGLTSNQQQYQNDDVRILLHPMKLKIPSGCVTAIIGPTNCGKSLLLKFLAGHMNDDSTIQSDGIVNLSGSKSFLGSKPDDVLLHSFYTPKTYMEHINRLITGQSKCTEETTNEINSLLNNLGFISNKRKNTKVGDDLGLSRQRGQLSLSERRRLILGLNVLGAPQTLFCDDPISGLDSETASSIMEFLKGYASSSSPSNTNNMNVRRSSAATTASQNSAVNASRRVVLTLNQPSSHMWNLIDNVILLSDGKLIYEGPKFDIETFFAHNKHPTPRRCNPVDHYIRTVKDKDSTNISMNCRHLGKSTDSLSVDEWTSKFKEWQSRVDEDDDSEEPEDYLADDIEACFTANYPKVVISNKKFSGVNTLGITCNKQFELCKRYFYNLLLNPGILWIRFGMYTMLSLLIGLLFFNLGSKEDTYATIQSKVSLLFYSVSFFIFMVVAVLPFTVHDMMIAKKEMFINNYYNPSIHYVAVTVSMVIPAVFILSLMTTVILLSMVKLSNNQPLLFFIDMFLSLFCAESIAMLVSIIVTNYIIGIVALAGLYGCFMLLQGFMLIPSNFPLWLSWSYYIPFHTYSWRSFMYLEFHNTKIDNIFDESNSSSNNVLKLYEIEQVNFTNDMIILLGYSLFLQILCLLVLISMKRRFNVHKKRDKEE